MTVPLSHILYAEDEPMVREIGLYALREIGGLNVEVCESGDQVLEAAIASRPEIILLDVLMPGLDGPDVLKDLQLNPETRAIPVVFVTAKTKPAEVKELMQAGAVDIVEKPFDPLTLSTEVQAIWDRYNAR